MPDVRAVPEGRTGRGRSPRYHTHAGPAFRPPVVRTPPQGRGGTGPAERARVRPAGAGRPPAFDTAAAPAGRRDVGGRSHNSGQESFHGPTPSTSGRPDRPRAASGNPPLRPPDPAGPLPGPRRGACLEPLR